MILRGISSPVQGGDAVNKNYADKKLNAFSYNLINAWGYKWSGLTVNQDNGFLILTPVSASPSIITYGFIATIADFMYEIPFSNLTDAPSSQFSVSMDGVSCVRLQAGEISKDVVTLNNIPDGFEISNPSSENLLCVGSIYFSLIG